MIIKSKIGNQFGSGEHMSKDTIKLLPVSDIVNNISTNMVENLLFRTHRPVGPNRVANMSSKLAITLRMFKFGNVVFLEKCVGLYLTTCMVVILLGVFYIIMVLSIIKIKEMH